MIFLYIRKGKIVGRSEDTQQRLSVLLKCQRHWVIRLLFAIIEHNRPCFKMFNSLYVLFVKIEFIWKFMTFTSGKMY